MQPIVDTQTLNAHVSDPRWVIVDCRHDLMDPAYGPRAYAAGHVPRAFFMHLDADLSGPLRDASGRFRGRHPLPDREALAEHFAHLGIEEDTTIVAYDDADGMFASRLWWLALWLGHGGVAVLDGGLRAWRAAGLPVTTEPPTPRARSSFAAREPLVRTIEAATLARDLGSARWRIIDARAAERYRGEVEPLDSKAGHIPGARNRPFRLNVTDDGRFRPAEELRAAFLEVMQGARMEDVVHQCGSGVSACHNLLAMAVAGMPDSVLYPGSWSEWSADPAHPVATGPNP